MAIFVTIWRIYVLFTLNQRAGKVFKMAVISP